MSHGWLEKSLERYIAGNLNQLSSAIHFGDSQELVFLGTQIKCRNGIIDLLCYSKFNVYVVECKAVEADESVVGQVLRYCNAVSMELNPYASLPPQYLEAAAEYIRYHICPVIVAPSFDRKLRGSNCALIQATCQADHTFLLERATHLDFRLADGELRETLLPFAEMVAAQAMSDLRDRKVEEARSINVWVN